MRQKTRRIAAVGDLHCSAATAGSVAPRLEGVSELADVLLLCGDLTEHGLPEEARALVRELAAVRIPKLAVLGNHDLNPGCVREVREILECGGIQVLDGQAVEIGGVGFAGVTGAPGGFDAMDYTAWDDVEAVLDHAQDEAEKLARALHRLHTPQRVVLMHYAPIRDTLRGERPELRPYLGSAYLAQPLVQYSVDAVFHGHAHRGTAEVRKHFGVPVQNVALPVVEASTAATFGPSVALVELDARRPARMSSFPPAAAF